MSKLEVDINSTVITIKVINLLENSIKTKIFNRKSGLSLLVSFLIDCIHNACYTNFLLDFIRKNTLAIATYHSQLAKSYNILKQNSC